MVLFPEPDGAENMSTFPGIAIRIVKTNKYKKNNRIFVCHSGETHPGHIVILSEAKNL